MNALALKNFYCLNEGIAEVSLDLIHRNPHIRIDLTRIDPIRRMIIVRQIGTDHKPMSVLIYRHLLILNTIIKVPVMFLVMPIRALKVQIIGLSMIGNA